MKQLTPELERAVERFASFDEKVAGIVAEIDKCVRGALLVWPTEIFPLESLTVSITAYRFEYVMSHNRLSQKKTDYNRLCR